MDDVSNVSQSKKQYIQDSLDHSDLPIITDFEKTKIERNIQTSLVRH